MRHYSILLSAAAVLALASCRNEPEPFGAVPTSCQLEWQKMETTMFVHFGPNTFTDSEWGTGEEDVDVFNPTNLDCDQWVAVAKAGGFKEIILTCKHHDGFSLWPNPTSTHTVAQSKWRDGKGDVLRELSDACERGGIRLGIYISPWDRNHPAYGSDEYNDVFVKCLEDALSNYGEVSEMWFDGACGEGPSGKRQVYDWNRFQGTVTRLQPQAVMFSDVGPGCRWVGNEYGFAGETCWSPLDTTGYVPSKPAPSQDTLNCGNRFGEAWVPAECDVSIRPGWFYRASENGRVKSLNDLLTIYYNSVGRNGLMLLNVPADDRGLICSIDSLRVSEFKAAVDRIFAENLADGAKISATSVRGKAFGPKNLLDGDYDSYWATPDDVTTASVELTFPQERTFNRVMLQEYIPLGQRVAAFHIDVLDVCGEWTEVASGTTIGYKRIMLFDRVTAQGVRVVIDKCPACVVLNNIGVFNDEIYVNGLENSNFELEVDPATFRIVSPAGAEAAIDGKPDADGRSGAVLGAKDALTVDLGSQMTLTGFFYEPMLHGANGCVITYDFLTSTDGRNWQAQRENAMFDNIVNNPIRSIVRFTSPVRTRYIRLVPRHTQLESGYGIGEIGVLVK